MTITIAIAIAIAFNKIQFNSIQFNYLVPFGEQSDDYSLPLPSSFPFSFSKTLFFSFFVYCLKYKMMRDRVGSLVVGYHINMTIAITITMKLTNVIIILITLTRFTR